MESNIPVVGLLDSATHQEGPLPGGMASLVRNVMASGVVPQISGRWAPVRAAQFSPALPTLSWPRPDICSLPGGRDRNGDGRTG
jgi:hypothetical protein